MALLRSLSLPLFVLSLYANAQSISVTVPSAAPGGANVVKDNFAGISLELNIINTLIGESPQTIPTAVQNYLKNIKSRMSQPFRLRVGGNSFDGSIYDPNASSVLSFNLNTTNNGVENVPVTFGPKLVDTLQQLGSNVGGISHLIGLSLESPQNDTNVIQFAQAVEKSLGDSFDAFLLGNEPDLYRQNKKRNSNYTIPVYFTDFGKVRDDLRNANLEKSPNLGGPSTCCVWTLTDAIKAGYISQFKDDLKYLSLQHYPQSSCPIYGNTNWNISYFTTHSNAVTLARYSVDGVSLAKAAGKEIVLSEYNSASCGGAAGKSNTFAAALWSIDYSLSLAIYNFSSAYVHTREPGVTYNLFNPPASGSSSWTTGPQYYSLLVLAETLRGASSNDSESVVVDLGFPDTSGGINAAGYAIYDKTGTKPQKILLLNFGSNSASTTPGNITQFTLPGGLGNQGKDGSSVSVKMLLAPTLTEETAITWAGQSVDGQGSLQGTVVETTVACSGGCSVQIPSPGAALVTLVGPPTSVVPSKPSAALPGPSASLIGTFFASLFFVSVIVLG